MQNEWEISNGPPSMSIWYGKYLGTGICSEPVWHGFIEDAAIFSLNNSRGAWDVDAKEKRATLEERHYRAYDAEGWAFLPLITSTSCNLSDTCLRLLFFLAVLQTLPWLDTSEITS